MVSQNPQDIDQWFNQIKTQRQDKHAETDDSAATNNLLHQLKQNHQDRSKNVSESSYQQNLEEILVSEQNKQRKRKQLETKAKQWLKSLSPESDEYLWFQTFAQSYPSQLEAAIEYLECLQQ